MGPATPPVDLAGGDDLAASTAHLQALEPDEVVEERECRLADAVPAGLGQGAALLHPAPDDGYDALPDIEACLVGQAGCGLGERPLVLGEDAVAAQDDGEFEDGVGPERKSCEWTQGSSSWRTRPSMTH